MTRPGLLLLLALALASGEECSEVEDPIKRDETAPGPWNISRVEWNSAGLQGKLVAVHSDSSHPLGPAALYEGDSYVIQYSVRKGRSPDVIYYWQGSKSSKFERGASAILTVQLDEATGNRARQARVEMGKEPGHFLAMMGGSFTTLLGGVERRKETVQDRDGVMLFRVRSQCNDVGAKKALVRTQQVEEVRASLNTEDAFILLDSTRKEVITWTPKGASPEEGSTVRLVAENVIKTVFRTEKKKPTPKALSGAQAPAELTDRLRS